MTVTAPSNLSFGKVVWQTVSDIVDGSDPDTTPDFVAPTGTVSFVASVSAARDITSSPNPVTVVRDPITGILDDEGYLCTPDPADPTQPGTRGVWLIATDDPDLNPVDWVYNVTYSIKGQNNRTITLKSHQIYVPTYEAPGDEVDLTVVGPVDNAQAIGIPAAEAAAASAQAAAAAAQAAAADAQTAADAIPETVETAVEDAAEVQMAGLELGYAERLSGVSNTATATGASAIISGLTVGPITGNGRAVDIEFYAPTVYHSVANTSVVFYLEVNGAALNGSGNISGITSPATNRGPFVVLKKRLVLTNGTPYTFRVGMYGGAAGTSIATAAGFAAIQLSVTSR